MDERSSLPLESLRRDLLRRGLPRDYVERVVGELDDHGADLRAEEAQAGPPGPSARERLGDPAALADAVTAQFRARTFAGRHPVLTFLVAPLPAGLVAWALGLALGLLAAHGAHDAYPGGSPGASPAWLERSLAAVLAVAVPGLLTLLFGRMASRAGRGWRWPCASCLLLMLLAGTLQVSLEFSPVPGLSRLTIGLGVPPHPLPMLVPPAFAAAYALRALASRRALAA